MAIQGYTSSQQRLVNTLQSIYGPNSNDEILLQMIRVLSAERDLTLDEVKNYMTEVIQRANASNYPVLVDSEGKLDLGLIYPSSPIPSIWEEIDIIGHPDGTFWAMILQGKWTIIANKEAYINLMLQIAQNIPTEVEPPRISFLTTSGFGIGVDSLTGQSSDVSVISFCATFYTKYGETTPSNILMSPITSDSGWSATIGLTKEPHSLVKSIYFYRTFGAQFRRVKTVAVNE